MKLLSETLKKLTDLRWMNLFEIEFENDDGARGKWQFVSRNERPVLSPAPIQPDAVFIVPLLNAAGGRRLVMTKEFRVPLGDYEYSFPAGLMEPGEEVTATIGRELAEETGLKLKQVLMIGPPVVSTAGLSDESAVIAFVECTGTPHGDDLDGLEEIEVLVLGYEDLVALRKSAVKFSAKAWSLLLTFEALGRIDWPFTSAPAPGKRPA